MSATDDSSARHSRLLDCLANLVIREVSMRRAIAPVAALAVGVSVASWGGARAAEIKVLSAAVMKPVFTELTGAFEQTTGHKLTISYVPAGEARRRVEAGEAFDVAILQRPTAEELAQHGKID